jgi:hypothetical protein
MSAMSYYGVSTQEKEKEPLKIQITSHSNNLVDIYVSRLSYLFIIMADFKSTKIILHELEELFQRDDDIRDVEDIQKMSYEIDAYYQANMKNAKDIIKRK